MAKGKAAAMAGMAKGKTLAAKGLAKGKVLAGTAGAKAKGAGLAIGNVARTFPKDAVKEFKGVKRAVKRTAKNFPNTFMKYPITTGAAAGLGVSAALPKKEKKKNKRNYG